jgi:hypothetical protein
MLGTDDIRRRIGAVDVALDPEEVLMCNNCGCELTGIPENDAPLAECPWHLCDCHAAYWKTVPELEKRRLWGDR